MKHYTPENYDPRTSIGLALNKARNLLTAEIDVALRDLDVSHQQMGVLLALLRGMSNTPFEMSRMLDIDSGLMTRMLDKMEQQDLLQRSRSVEDRRVVNLQLTRHGKHVANEITKRAPLVLNARLKEFTAAEFNEFHRLLSKFIGA